MVKISDILRRGRDEEEEPEKKKFEQENAKEKAKKEEVLHGPPKEVEEEKAPLETKRKIKIAPLIMGETKIVVPEIEKTYQDLITLIENILSKVEKDEPIKGKEIMDKIDSAVNQMALAGDELLGLVTGSISNNYLYAHLVNVCLLSIRIGLGLGYNKSKLNELGISGFLHDVGMLKVLDITQRSWELSMEEYEAVKQHPVHGAEILEKIVDLPKAVIYVTLQHHERINGTGYPKGVKGDEINEYACVVSLVDTFEALTNPRPYRKRFLPYAAIKEILQNKDQFNHHLIKVLIEEIGIYPMGSWVELNTGEVSKVIRVNKDFPLHPTLNVIFDPDGHKLEEVKSIELIKCPTLYIKNPLDGSELETKMCH